MNHHSLYDVGLLRIPVLEQAMAWLVENGPLVAHPNLPAWTLKALVKDRRIVRLRRGLYLVPDRDGHLPSLEATIQHVAPTGYITGWAALAHHGLTDQDPGRWAVVTPERNAGFAYGRATVDFHTSPSRAAGADIVIASEGRHGPGVTRWATAKQAFIDLLDRPELGPDAGSVAGSLRTGIEGGVVGFADLVSAVTGHGAVASARRLGFLGEIASNSRLPGLLPLAHRSHNWSRLGTSETVARDSRWRLLLPLPVDVIRARAAQ
jgi:predicted transcriptional regulator of viral defense system